MQLDLVDTVPLAEFRPEVLMGAADAPPDMVDSYIRESAIYFAERSQVLRRAVHIEFQACVDVYPIELAGQERVISIQGMGEYQGVYPPATRLREGGQEFGGCYGATTCICHGHTVALEGLEQVRVEPVPKSHRSYGVWLRLAVAPTRDACEVDRLLYERYHEAIINGALARLCIIKGTPWYDAALSTYFRELADKAITAAGLDRLTNGRRGPYRMVHRRIV